MKESKKSITRLFKSFLYFFSPNFLYPHYIYLKTKRKFKKIIYGKKQFYRFQKKLDKINEHEFKITSQNNEDGLIDFIFKKIPHNKNFVEIGIGYYECNSLNLIKNGWNGKIIEINKDEILALKKNLPHYYPQSRVEFVNSEVTKDNINNLVFSDNLNKEIDFFSLDIDGNDYWVLKNINLSNVKVICCEYNSWLGNKKLVMKHNKNFRYANDAIYGASLVAITDLLKQRGFSLVATESTNINAFFVKDEFKDKFEILSPTKIIREYGTQHHYSPERKKEIYNHMMKNLQKFEEV